jgi:hypothetical protein
LKDSILKDSFLKYFTVKDSGFVKESHSERFNSERFRDPGKRGSIRKQFYVRKCKEINLENIF